MDEFTREHLTQWLLGKFGLTPEGEEADKLISDFVEAHPVVLERGDSWSEILRLAERNR